MHFQLSRLDYLVFVQSLVCGHQARKEKSIETSWMKSRSLRTCTPTMSLLQLQKTIQPMWTEKRAKRSTEASTTVRSRPSRHTTKRSNLVHCRNLRSVLRAVHDDTFTSRRSSEIDLLSFGNRLNQNFEQFERF